MNFEDDELIFGDADSARRWWSRRLAAALRLPADLLVRRNDDIIDDIYQIFTVRACF